MTPFKSFPIPSFKIDGISPKFQETPWSKRDPEASAPYNGEENFKVFQN